MTSDRGGPVPLSSAAYDRVAATSAFLAAAAGLLYGITFLGLVLTGAAPELGFGLSSLVLLIGGLVAIAALAGLFPRLWRVDPAFALLALLFGVAGAVGATIHGGYDLANVLHPPPTELTEGLPSEVDPRGLLTFGAAGLGALIASWLIVRSPELPSGLGYLGYLAGALLVVIYLGRLVILDPTNPLVAAPAALAGFIVNPAWYVWLGLVLLRRPDVGSLPVR